MTCLTAWVFSMLLSDIRLCVRVYNSLIIYTCNRNCKFLTKNLATHMHTTVAT